ncbi:Histidine kinase 5-like protein 2 [Stagonosporopsis vannaccii]|nr:Histidine kinase 5-like protein 2 [Stagonosporopsis vannaccii]
MATNPVQQVVFFPKADAAVLSCRLASPSAYPETVGPVYDHENASTPVAPWSAEVAQAYPLQDEPYAPAPIPNEQRCSSDRYLRASLAENERFRLSMLWYYTRDIFKETEFVSGLQEKVGIAQETTGWDVAIVGVLDVNFYTRLAAIGAPLGILPRGETLCAHTVTQPPGSVFLLPNMLEDWRFAKSPYVESGGLCAYAGAPLRLQNEAGETACLGSLCVASSTSQQPLTKSQQTTLVRLADWIVSDIVQLTRARRQRDRRRMVDLIATVQSKTDGTASEKSVIQILQAIYPDAVISIHSSSAGSIELEGRDPLAVDHLSTGLWEDTDYISDIIANSNHLELPTNRVVRVLAAQCESVSGLSLLTVGTKDFRLVFDDIDAWFVQTCADIVSQTWHKHLLAEVMHAKEKFLRGFSHQLRTPVHGILGSVELMSEELKSLGFEDTVPKAAALLKATQEITPIKGHEVYLDTIKRAGRDLISIINSMITLNRWSDIAMRDRLYATHTTYELETELANEILKATSGDTRYSAHIFFNHNMPPDRCTLRTDLGLLRDSLLPIIMNAIQSTPEGTVAVTMTVRPNLREFVVDVEDTGRGIQADDQQRIFELYEQADTYSTGAGVGLTLATKFAALLEGTVELVQSEINRGSHFRVTFQDVELHCSELPFLTAPVVPGLANLPRCFHIVPHKPDALSLCGQFANFLTCYGFSHSDNIKDALVIFEHSNDLDQRHAYLSRLSPDQVAICLLPFAEEGARFENPSKNVVYVHGPFISATMSAALVHADQLFSDFKSNKEQLVQATKDLLICSRFDGYRCGTAMKDTISDPSLISSEAAIAHRARVLPKVSEQARHEHVESLNLSRHKATIDITQHAKQTIAGASPNTSALSITQTDKPVLLEGNSLQSTSTPTNPAITSHPTVLIVDDNDVNLRVMQMYCQKRNLPYVCAKDGLEAVSAFQKHQDLATTDQTKLPIQLILMDLQMPRCNGVEATKQIRQLEQKKGWDKSVVFIVTGQDSHADREAAVHAGSHEYYVKPVGIKTLDGGLKRYFPSFEAMNRPR